MAKTRTAKPNILKPSKLFHMTQYSPSSPQTTCELEIQPELKVFLKSRTCSFWVAAHLQFAITLHNLVNKSRNQHQPYLKCSKLNRVSRVYLADFQSGWGSLKSGNSVAISFSLLHVRKETQQQGREWTFQRLQLFWNGRALWETLSLHIFFE